MASIKPAKTLTNGQTAIPVVTPSPPVTSSKQLREDVQRLQLGLQKKLLEAQTAFYDQFVDPREPLFDVHDFWLPLGFQEQVPFNLDSHKRGEVLPIYITEPGLKIIRDMSRRTCAYNEFAINALDNRVNYIIGKGFQYEIKGLTDDVPAELIRSAQRVVDDFIEATDWCSMEQEIVRRCDRDGEAFLRFFPQADGLTAIRLIEPEHIKTPPLYKDNRAYLFGVETEPLDVETVLAYWLIDDPDVAIARDRVKAHEILHIKMNVDRTAKRGLPTFFAVRKNFERADKLLRNMSLMAQVQATFSLIRKHKGYARDLVDNFKTNLEDFKLTSSLTGRASSFQQLQPGSIVDAPEGVEYDFPGGTVNAGGFVQVLQAELRAIASRLNMPEAMLSANQAEMAAYTAAAVAETPSVKNFERLQYFFKRKLGIGRYHRHAGCHCPAMWRVLYNAVAGGRLDPNTLKQLEIQTEGPSLYVRDPIQEAQKNQILFGSSVLSPQTWAQKEGLDYEREQLNREEWQERTGGGGGMGNMPLGIPGQQEPISPTM